MRKIAISSTHGGFSLSDTALTILGLKDDWDLKRDDPRLIALIESMGPEAVGGDYSSLAIVEIPDDVSWHIAEYDGAEWIAEDHRRWHAEEVPCK
jgi:hypothetical protein